MKRKFRKFLSVLLTASMVSSLFAGTAMAQGAERLFKAGTPRPRLIVSSTADDNPDAGNYQEADVTIASAANAAIATDSNATWTASPSNALEISVDGDTMHLQVKDGYDRAAMSKATVSNATQEVLAIVEADGKTYQGKVDLVANWFDDLYSTADPQVDEIRLDRYGLPMGEVSSGKNCECKVTNDDTGEEMKDVSVTKEEKRITLNLANADRSTLQRYKVEIYNQEGKLCGYCYVTVYPRPSLEINGIPVSGNNSVAKYIGGLSQSDLEKVTALAISGGSMSYADWNSIHSLKNLQTLEVAADVNAAQTQEKIPSHTFEDMASLETFSLNTASEEKAAGPRSADDETEINYINVSAFKGCTSLTTVEIPGVWGIDSYTFADCKALKSVTGPDLLIAGSYVFSGCKALQTAVFPELNSIGIYAFANCTSLSTLKLPKVGYIFGGSFQNCSNLEYIMLPASPPMLLGAASFDGVTLPLSAYTLVDREMNPLKGDDLQESLRKYSRYSAWRDILGLPDPDYKGKISFSAQINGDHIDTVSGDSMEACLNQMLAAYPGSSLSDIERIDGVLGTVTEEDWKIIEKLTGLQGLAIGYFATPTEMEGAIPEGLKMPKSLARFDLYSTNDMELPAGMFEGCAKLDTIAMNRVTKIGSRVFAGCTALGSGDFRLPDVPPVLGDDVFAGITMQKGVLRTMSGTADSLQAYLNAGGQWQAWFGETSMPQPQPQPKPQSGSSSSSSASQSGKWVLNGRGWWYDYGNSLWPSNQWSYLYYNGHYGWYYFDREGYMVTGWYTDAAGRTYYLHPLADGHRGYMYRGWNQIDGVWYYFSTESGASNGMLLKNTVTPDGFQVDENGAWVQ